MTDKIEDAETFGPIFAARIWDAMRDNMEVSAVYAMTAALTKERDDLMQMTGKRAVLDELTRVASCFALDSTVSPYRRAWEILDAKYSKTPKEIKAGSKWQGYKMNAEVISIIDDGVNYWHTHHDGTRSVYRTTVDFFRHNCDWLEDPREILPRSIWKEASSLGLNVEVHEVQDTYVTYVPVVGGLLRNVPRDEWYARFSWVSDAQNTPKSEVAEGA